MSLDLIRQALEVAVNAITPALKTAWENSFYNPNKGEAYQRVTLLPAAPANVEMTSGNRYQASGVLVVMLCYPINAGPADAQSRAVLVLNTFPRGRSLTSGGVTVQIAQTPEIGTGAPDGEFYCLPVKIRYFANINL